MFGHFYVVMLSAEITYANKSAKLKLHTICISNYCDQVDEDVMPGNLQK